VVFIVVCIFILNDGIANDFLCEFL